MFKNCVFKPSVDTMKWLKKAGIRAVKTMAQTAVGGIGACDWALKDLGGYSDALPLSAVFSIG